MRCYDICYTHKLWFHLADHSDGDVRLTDGDASGGIVEVFTDGDWHLVCDDNTWDEAAVNRLCTDLGHTSGVIQSASPLLSNTVICANVSCTAAKERLSDCIALSSSSQCTSNTVLKVTCRATSELVCYFDTIMYFFCKGPYAICCHAKVH